MKIEICQDTKSAILWTVALLCSTGLLAMVFTYGHIKDRRDQALQQTMLEQGYSPSEVACAWNINQPACLVQAIKKGINNDDATH